MANQGEKKSQLPDLPADIKDWTAEQVKHWVLQLEGVDEADSEILFKAKIKGQSLLILDLADIKSVGVCLGPAKLIIQARDELLKQRTEQVTSSTNKPSGSCRPSPFGRYHDGSRYTEATILTITESGALDLIEPCHEFKAFTNTTPEKKLEKFTNEVIRFGAACMNSRTNGTIHFGIGDKPHGEVLGVVVEDKEAYENSLRAAIKRHFQPKCVEAALKCIKHPRFVRLLNKDQTSSDKYVIEVDIVPDSEVTKCHYYLIYNMGGKDKQCYVRDGASTCNIHPKTSAESGNKENKKFEQFKDKTKQLLASRKCAEQNHLSVIKRSTHGSRLIQMITGGTLSLDKSHFEQYVIVANKLPPALSESLQFLVELNPTAVLDFDPESAQDGLHHFFSELSPVTVHIPADYKITEGVEDIAERLKLTRTTSWVFCNGGVQQEHPSDVDKWLMEKGESVREVSSFLCRKEVLPNNRFLVIFLVFSTLAEEMDPLVNTFITFCQQLRGHEKQLLCICDSEKTFISWKDQIFSQCRIDISSRSVFELSFAEVNATTLSLFSTNRLCYRFLPSVGGGTVLLEKKFERSLSAIEVLCTNQCEGGHEDKKVIEENFYKGGKVSWWNFYFSEEPGSSPFIKRDKFDFIIDMVIPHMCSSGNTCAVLNLLHLPGCGGTTLAMHILWVCRKKFRCAVLRDNTANFAEIAAQVVQLLTFKHVEKSSPLPVLLMIDDFDDKEKVFDLKELIEEECAKKCIRSKSAQVIILNCMTSESPVEAEDKVFIGNVLSDAEKQLFDKKLTEIEKTHPNAQETFYGFMFMKKNFSAAYAQGVARKTLRSFNISQKEAQLLAILALLHKYCRCASLSVSLCEEFLDLKTQPVCGTSKVEDGFGSFSTLITTCRDESKVVFKAVKMIHSSIAGHCLEELTTTHNVSKAKITELLLTTDKLYECTQGKDKLLQDIHHILVRRYSSQEKVSLFSPLIQDIAEESPGLEETVLENAVKRLAKNPIINQLVARYYYLKKRNYPAAKRFAKRAKELSKDSSFIADTTAQVIKHEIKSIIEEHGDHLDPQTTKKLLEMSETAIESFQETQRLAKIESLHRLKIRTDKSAFNTSGFLGEIQLYLIVIQVLEKTPVFSPQNCRSMLSQVLSGELKLADVAIHDQCNITNRPYHEIFREFKSLLHNVKRQMKEKINVLDNFFVNLGSRFGMKDSRDQESQRKLSEYFSKYAELFCTVDPATHSWNPEIQKLQSAKKYLEKNKVDSYLGILSCLSNFTHPQDMERIIDCQKFILRNYVNSIKDRINFIYVNIVLSCIKPESPVKLGYSDLTKNLFQVLGLTNSMEHIMPLYFIAVVLLWPDQSQFTPKCEKLSEYISQLRACYHNQMKDMYNGKRPIVHFFLGKKPGYGKMIHQNREVIKRYISLEDEWEDGKIWREKEVKDLLRRVQGVVNRDSILVGPQRLEVSPVFKSQLSRYNQGSRVSFFVGFTMKGPVALDIA